MKGKFAKVLESLKREYIVSSAVIIVLGIILAIFPSETTNLCSYLIAALFVIVGAIIIFHFVKEKDFTFWPLISIVAAAALTVFGIFIFIKPGFITSFLWLLFGIVLVVDGVYKILHAITLGKNGAERWWIVLIIAAVTTLFGLLIIVNTTETKELFIRLIGVALIIDGVSDISSTIYLSKVAKKILAEPETEE